MTQICLMLSMLTCTRKLYVDRSPGVERLHASVAKVLRLIVISG